MPRKTRPDKPEKRGARGRSSYGETRTPRPKPKIDFTCDTLDFKNITLLRTFVTDQGRILPRKYTGLAGALSAPAQPRHQARTADAADEVKEEATLERGFSILVGRLNRL